MRIHILGICGTFMGGLAVLASQMGYTVTGSDENVYPPMSDTLRAAGIDILEGFEPSYLEPKPDCVIIGNAMSRGHPAVEAVLNKGLPYTSGPQWLAEHVLKNRHVLAVSGTHGKTTTSSMLAWILQYAELNPGFLIGGVPSNFNKTAELGSGKYFVVEADEYDSAFFDKRSKFVHYRPNTLVINNLEFDHADIFTDLTAIQAQFAILLRTVPGAGVVIYPESDDNIQQVINQGCWSATQTLGGPVAMWHADNVSPDGSAFDVWHRDQRVGRLVWSLLGQHNVANGLAAIAAAHDAGVTVDTAIKALANFKGVKRRLEVRGVQNGITVYDDFAHHPTAIATTLAGLRARVGTDRVLCVMEFGSQTMRMGVHQDALSSALMEADRVLMLKPKDWDLQPLLKALGPRARAFDSVDDILRWLREIVIEHDHVIVMSNKGFANIHQRLLAQLTEMTEKAENN